MESKEIKRKIKIAIDNTKATSYIDFLSKKFDIEKIYSFTELSKDKLKELDMIVFTGGADVSPKYYDENKGKFTHTNPVRDKKEYAIAKDYRLNHVFKLGICRGSQLLTVANGGKLIQHVTNHTKSHDISILLDHVPNIKDKYFQNGLIDDVENSLVLPITSTHHQMMYPFNLKEKNYDLIAWSTYFQSDTYLNGDNEERNIKSGFLEPEIVYYKNKNSLCIQGHPEFGNCEEETVNVCLDIIESKLAKKEENV